MRQRFLYRSAPNLLTCWRSHPCTACRNLDGFGPRLKGCGHVSVGKRGNFRFRPRLAYDCSLRREESRIRRRLKLYGRLIGDQGPEMLPRQLTMGKVIVANTMKIPDSDRETIQKHRSARKPVFVFRSSASLLVFATGRRRQNGHLQSGQQRS